MNLLIAGYGYVGSVAAQLAKQKGWDVTSFSKSGGPGIETGDLSSLESLTQLKEQLGTSPDTIIHCASSGRGGAEAYQQVFLNGVQHLKAVFPSSHLLFVSSSSVYGQTDGSTVTEQSRTQPERETSQILVATEQKVLLAGGTVARLAGIYGPERSILLKKFLTGEATIEEDGRRIINQIHRDDAASALVHLVQQGSASQGEIYNIADSNPMSQLQYYQKFSELFDQPLPPTGKINMGRKRAWTHKLVCNGKILSTGWAPEFPSFFDALSPENQSIHSSGS